MKICWANLEGLYISKMGSFKKGNAVYVYKEACAKCGQPYLTGKYWQSRFCGRSCGMSGKNHPLYGKTHTIETRKKISNAVFGKRHSIETRKKISKAVHNYMEDIYTIGSTVYDTYKDRLELYEDVRKQRDTEMLEVRCTYCGRWYAPTYIAVNNRINAANSLDQGECRLYCSENCKQACPTYNQTKYPRGFKHATSREVDPYLRQMVLERDNWTCQICGRTIEEVILHCHHMDPVAQNSMFQNDMDSCITLCKKCHAMVHSRIGCRYVDLQCKTNYGGYTI